MIHLFKEAGYDMEKKTGEDAYHFRTMFRRRQ